MRSTIVEALGLCRLLRRRSPCRGLGRSFGCVGHLGVGLKAGVALEFDLVVIGPGPGFGLGAVSGRTGLDVHCCSLPGPVLAVEFAVAPLELADVAQGWKSDRKSVV